MRLRHAFVSCALAAGFAGGATESSRAGFEIRAHQAFIYPSARQTTFTLEFTSEPDFFTAASDEVGTERHAFQYFIDVEPLTGGDPFAGPDVTVVRGPEIRFDHDGALRVRATEGPDDGDRANGGWGPLRGAVPYELDGEVVRFTLPWELVGDTDGAFAYVVESYEDGALTSSLASAGGIVLPLPAGAWTGLSALGGIWVARWARTRVRRTQR
jgi:hypothetical protein